MNVITLVGRAGRDPEVRYFESGTNVCNLTIAVNRRKKDEDPDWFNLEIWGKTAEVAANYVKKGGLISVTGSMHQDEWTDRTTGEKKTKWVVRVDKFDLLSSKRDSDGGGGALPAQSPASAPAQAAAPQPTWRVGAAQAAAPQPTWRVDAAQAAAPQPTWRVDAAQAAAPQPTWRVDAVSDENVPF